MLLLHLAAAPSVLAVYATAAAYGIALVQLGDAGPSAGLIQCERTLCVAAGRWQCTAAHRLWRLECPRQQCWSLTCVLGPQQTAAVGGSSSDIADATRSMNYASQAQWGRFIFKFKFKPISQ